MRISLVLLTLLLGARVFAAPVTTLIYTPDQRELVSNGMGRIDVRSAADGKVVRSIQSSIPRISTLSFAPDGKTLFVAGGIPGEAGMAELRQWPDGKILFSKKVEKDQITASSFVTNDLIWSGDEDNSLILWERGEPRNMGEAHTGPITALITDPRARFAVTASADRSIKLWELSTRTSLRTLSYHTDVIRALAVRTGDHSERSFECASAGDDRTIRIWQPEIGRMVRIIRNHSGSILALAYSPDGRALYSAGSEGVLRRFDAASDELQKAWPATGEWIYTIAISRDGQRIATGDWTGTVRVFNAGD